MGFPLGYSHSHPIPKHTQQNNNEQMQTVDSRAAEKQFLRKLDINRNSKNTIHITYYYYYYYYYYDDDYYTRLTVLFQDNLGKPVPEK